ncbi:MAG: hypothetical protein Q3962_05255 [Corynebacterium sp.]|nr:hypothetical protein [Corynebacterium sp.]
MNERSDKSHDEKSDDKPSINLNININTNGVPQQQGPLEGPQTAEEQSFQFDVPVQQPRQPVIRPNLNPTPPPAPNIYAAGAEPLPVSKEDLRKVTHQRAWPWLAVIFDICWAFSALAMLTEERGLGLVLAVISTLSMLLGAFWYIYCRHIDREHLRAWKADVEKFTEANSFLSSSGIMETPLNLPDVPEKYRPASWLIIWANVIGILLCMFYF